MDDVDKADIAPLCRLMLLVAGPTLRSRRAIENLLSICDNELKGHADVQIVDIFDRPDLAQEYQVVAAPTLLRLLPLPVRRIVGDLSDRDRVLAGLEFEDTSVVVDDWPLADGG